MAPPDHPGQGHRARLRERFLAHGLSKFTDEEVLELLLTLATPRRDCKQQARQLMKRLGGLAAVLEAPPKELAAVKGVGPRNILGIKLVPAVARRYQEDRLLRGQPIAHASQAAEYLGLTMRPMKQEVFRVMLLDGQRRVMAVEDLFWGTLNQAAVYPREVVALALSAGAAGIICAHNHPSGSAQPSQRDRQLTRQLYHACRGVELELVDHLVVGQRDIYSFAQQGEIQALAGEYQEMRL